MTHDNVFSRQFGLLFHWNLYPFVRRLFVEIESGTVLRGCSYPSSGPVTSSCEVLRLVGLAVINRRVGGIRLCNSTSTF